MSIDFAQATDRKAAASLPKEVTALIHHIELNKDGWWDKAAERLVLATIWLDSKPLNSEQITASLESSFRLKLSNAKLDEVLLTLEQQDSLVKLPGDLYRIPDAKRREFERELQASEQAETAAKRYFARLVDEQNLKLDPVATWGSFSDKFLSPLIKEVGADAYRLVTGQGTLEGNELVETFLKGFPQEYHQQLCEVAQKFLNPKIEDARAYISRLLHARLCVEASGLPEDVIAKIRDSNGKPIRFRIFVDTNFLFSLMDLHENPSNETANELQELIQHLKSNLKIDLYITPKTIVEARVAIQAARNQLSGIPTGNNFTTAALHSGLSGMSQKYLLERNRNGRFLTPEEWFQPYIDNFVAIARSKGIEIYNESQDDYSKRQDVIDDILQVRDFEKGLPEPRRKSYERIEHDMVLWHFVYDKRAAYVESPIEARDWILTVDFRFIGFDQHKLRQASRRIPICLHPTSLIQLLQFWVPRTKEFEEAMLGSLRLPFLFQEFDADAERTTLKILRGLGRFEGNSEMSEKTIANVILNDGLRARLADAESDDAEITFIRDALLEESNKRLEAEKQRAQELESEIQNRDDSLSKLDGEKRAREEEIERLRAQMESADRRSAEQDSVIAGLKSKEKSRDAMQKYFAMLISVIALSVLIGWACSALLPRVTQIIGQVMSISIFALLGFIAGHLTLEMWHKNSIVMNEIWPFVLVKRLRGWLWSFVVLSFLAGIIGNLVANDIQSTIDHNKQEQSETSE
jgi:hypothetical protein